MRVKICGIREVAHGVFAARAGANFLGFVFVPKTRRYLDRTAAKALIRAIRNELGERWNLTPSPFPSLSQRRGVGELDHHLSSVSERACPGPVEGGPQSEVPLFVGLFVNEDPSYVNEVAGECGLDIVQLHGDEPPEVVAQIEHPVIRALRPRAAADLGLIDGYVEAGARIMIDAYQPGHWGGSGVAADWQLAAAAARRFPIILAGGLSPENVGEAIGAVQPWGVDVSSGIETDGRKDVQKIQAFIDAVRRVAAAGEATRST